MLATTDCVLGIGANLGDREQTFAWALEQLAQFVQVVAISNIYENPAIGGPPQPDFLNAAVRIRTALEPAAILEATQGIEYRAGRVRLIRWGPRTLDLDLLWIPDQILESEQLRLPHPRLIERPFALLPLVEVAPYAAHPATGVVYSKVLESHSTAELRLHSIAEGSPWRWRQIRPRAAGAGPAGVMNQAALARPVSLNPR